MPGRRSGALMALAGETEDERQTASVHGRRALGEKTLHRRLERSTTTPEPPPPPPSLSSSSSRSCHETCASPRSSTSSPRADAAATFTELTGRPARTLAPEPVAAARGVRTTPGLPRDTVVCDIGGGTVDLIGPGQTVVAAGAGETITVAVARILGIPHALAETVKRTPSIRVEGPHLAHEEDGRRVFLNAVAGNDAIGRLCTRGSAGLVPFSDRLAAEEWRSLRLAIKEQTVAANMAIAAVRSG